MLGQELYGIQIVGLLGRLQIDGLFEGGNGALQPVLSRITVTQQVVDRSGALALLDRLQESSAAAVDPVGSKLHEGNLVTESRGVGISGTDGEEEFLGGGEIFGIGCHRGAGIDTVGGQ